MNDMIPSDDPNDLGPDSDVEWGVVAQVFGMMEADILAGSLKAAGIPVWISYESAGRAIGLSMGPLGRIEIVVPMEYYDQALELLEGGDEEEWLEEEDEDEEDADFLEAGEDDEP